MSDLNDHARGLANIPHALKFLWQSARWTFVWAALTNTLSGLIPVALGIMVKLTVDHIVNNRSEFKMLWILVSIQLVLSLLAIALQHIGDLTRIVMRDKIQSFVRWQVAEHATKLDLEYFEIPGNYDLFSKAKRDLGFRPFLLGYAVIFSIQQFGVFVGFFAAAYSISPLFSLILLLAAAPAFFTISRTGSETYAAYDLTTPAGRRAEYLEDLLSDDRYAKDVRLLGFSPSVIQELKETLTQTLIVQWKAQSRKAVLFFLNDSFGGILQYIVIAISAWQVMQGQASIGDFTLMIAATSGVRLGLAQLLANLSDVNENSIFFNDLSTFLATPAKIVAPPTPETWPASLSSGWVFKDVTFSYPGSETPVLKNFSLEIPLGQTTALVGVNGAGKSTIVKLLSRLYDPQHGEISISGIDIKSFDPKEYRQNLSVVLQDFSRFQLSLRENIMLGAGDKYGAEGVAQAIRQSGLEVTVNNLPEKFDSMLGRQFHDRGVELSGGQWQRVALARAFYRQALLLLLDEPTSALDAEAEQELFRQYYTLMQNRTTLFITHRLQTAKIADNIIVMEAGNIIESGTHKELLDLGGRYADMFYASQDFLIGVKENEDNRVTA